MIAFENAILHDFNVQVQYEFQSAYNVQKK